MTHTPFLLLLATYIGIVHLLVNEPISMHNY